MSTTDPARSPSGATDLTRPPTQSDTDVRSIGPYRLLEKIGEGGMGEVWLAEQTRPMRRHVALKVIKAGMDTKQVVARFEAERQALAVMDHPNIAKVFDGGSTTEGRPYFVMEYVRGEPITDYCDRVKMPLRLRLELFATLCDGIQHAHQKGIIHRDLKPSNILVCEVGDRAVPRIIDFGIAKATAQRLTDAPMHTEIGSFIGTPEYMSPEQADMTLDVDTRSDVYSLGMILYELLTGTLPFDSETLRSGSAEDLRRVIRESEPPRLSTRVRHVLARSADVASRRGMQPSKLVAVLRVELEWISLKAIEKDRTRRYPTANALSLDIGRYLRDEPVSAGRPGTTYRLRKFVRRNQRLVTTGVALAVTLVAGIVGTTWQAAVAQDERDTARREAANAQAVTNFVVESLKAQDPIADGRQDTTVAEAMRVAAARIESGDLKDQPETAAMLQRTIAAILKNASKIKEATPLAESSFAVERTMHAGDHVHIADSLFSLADVYIEAGNASQAEPLLLEAVGIRQRLSDGDTVAQLDTIQRLADARATQSKFVAALEANDEALRLARSLFPEGNHRVARGFNLAGFIERNLGNLERAEALYSEALQLHRRLARGDHPDVAVVMSNLGATRRRLGKFQEAEPVLREALAMNRRLFSGDHIATAVSLQTLGQNLQALGKLQEAEALLTESIAMSQRLYATDHHQRAAALAALAGIYLDQGRFADAERAAFASVRMNKRLFKKDHQEIVVGLQRLARSYAASGRLDLALENAREANAMNERLHPAGSPARKSANDFLASLTPQASIARPK